MGCLPVPKWFLHGSGRLVGPASPSPHRRKSLGLLCLLDTHQIGTSAAAPHPHSSLDTFPQDVGPLNLSSISFLALATMHNRIMFIGTFSHVPSAAFTFWKLPHLLCSVLGFSAPSPQLPEWVASPSWALSLEALSRRRLGSQRARLFVSCLCGIPALLP